MSPDDRAAFIERYRRNRVRSRALFDLVDPSAYYSRPITLRNPIVFYEGHFAAFSVISFLARGLRMPGVNERFERLFARGIDPDSEEAAVPRSGPSTMWPSREEVLAFGEAVDAAVVDAIEVAPLGSDTAGGARGSRDALYAALEHEEMHQETLLYMLRRLPHEQKRRDDAWTVPAYERGLAPPRYDRVGIPAGVATLGAQRDQIAFGWDNEFDAHHQEVAAFDIDVYNVTNADYLAFVEAGGYRERRLWSDMGWQWLQRHRIEYPSFWIRRDAAWFWRGMFEDIPLPASWPVYVSHDEASAYARWKGRRLPTEAEYHCAASGASTTAGNFDFQSWEPLPVGARPAGASVWGVEDLVGNGWEWTSTIFGPFPGFEPMAAYPEYSVDFFDEGHYVLKGASPATAKDLVRSSFRNWFRPNYPYIYATFRTVAKES